MDVMISAFAELMHPATIAYLMLGVLLGLLVGALPALGGVAGLSILLPFVFMLDPFNGLVLFMGMLASTNTSDTLPAVLFGIPGSSSSQATIMDGHPMAKKGQAARALAAAYTASLLGGLVGALFLILCLQFARPIILSFGSPELFMLGVLGLSLVGTLSAGVPLKGLVAAGIGMLVSTVGISRLTATDRYTFGSLYLYDGIDVVVVAMGIFAIPEILASALNKTPPVAVSISDIKGGRRLGILDALRSWFLVLRTGIIGALIGILPGLGGSAIGWFAYVHARQTEKGAKETFGKGDVRGVIGADASNNASDGGGLLPTLAFGIPGSTSMALLLTVIVGMGLPVGPQLLVQHQDFVASMIIILVFANLACTGIMLSLIPQTARIAQLPFRPLVPLLIVLVVFAAYASGLKMGDLVALGVFSVLGWFMRIYGWPRPPLVLGFVMGPILERYLFNSVDRYGADFLYRPLVVLTAVLIVFVVGRGVWSEMRDSRERAARTAPVAGEKES